jgi:transposase-like protein
MTKTQVEVITSVERRRRWSRAEKERIVAAAMEPGAVASSVAQEAGIHASQLYRWRQELCGSAGAAPGFAAVTIAAEPCVYRKLDSAISVVEPIENRSRDDGTKALDRSMNGSVLVQGAMRPRSIIIVRVGLKDPAQVPLAKATT